MPGPQETYLAHLATLGIDATQIAVDSKGTVTVHGGSQPAPRPAERLPRLVVVGGGAETSEPESDPATPDLQMEDRLGKGGMGVVWSATQVALRRRVAVKRLLDERVGPEAEAQLLREALVTGGLEHPNIVPVHALGRDEDGRPLLVMKRIEGTPWSRSILPLYPEQGSADPEAVEHHLGILMQVCRALEFAHAQGVVHRDIKPENVMVGSFGEVYVLDWGIAVSIASGHTGLPTLEPGTLAGTPGYMAPEMAAAQVDRIDQRTDVYLLGATLHELITGNPRHAADGVFATLTRAWESEPIEYPDRVPAELAQICNRATHKDPERRFPSAKALREALTAFLRHGSARALADEAWQRLDVLDDILGEDLRTVTADAIQIHALASEARFAFERSLEEWPDNREARQGLQRLLESMIRYELSNGNLRTVAGLVAALPRKRPELERALREATEAQAERRREIARLEQLRYEADTAVASKSRGGWSYVNGITLAVGALTLFGMRMLGLHEPGYPDAIVVAVVLAGAVFVGRRSLERKANEVNRKLFDSILVAVVAVGVSFVVGMIVGIPFPQGLSLGMVVAGATAGISAVFFDRRMFWTAIGFTLTALAIALWPVLRGLWVAVGGFASFAVTGMVWREVRAGKHASQKRDPSPRSVRDERP